MSFEHYRPPRPHRRPGQPADPRRDEVRRVGQPRPRRSIATIHPALDAGINLMDTADVYAHGESEEIVGDAMRPAREAATTSSWPPSCTARWATRSPPAGNSRRWIVREVEALLRRLHVDHIDLYQVHRPARTSTSTRPSAR